MPVIRQGRLSLGKRAIPSAWGIFVCMRAEAPRKPDIKLFGRFLLRLLAETFRPFPSLSVPFFFSFFRTLWPSWRQSILLRCLVVNPEALLLLYADKVRLCLTEKQFTFLLRFLCLLFRPDTFSSYSGLTFGALFIYLSFSAFFSSKGIYYLER